MKQRIVYEVRGELDTNEGRGGTFLVGFWDTKDAANIAAQGRGVWGEPGSIEEVHGFYVSVEGQVKFVKTEDLHTINTESKDKVIERAKSKLTTDELIALGLM
jgi:hypothetical protein